MLVELITGSNLTKIFEAGAKTADLYDDGEVNEEEESRLEKVPADSQQSPGVSVSRLCTAEDRTHHWHTCAGCLLGRPCNHFDSRDTQLMLCSDCSTSNKATGWKIAELCRKSSAMSTNHSSHFSRKTVQEALHMWMTNNLDALGEPYDQHLGKIDQAWKNLVHIFGTENAKEWHDIYIKNAILSEDVARAIGWTGRGYSPFALSVEAIRHIFVKDGVLQYPCDGNLGVTSVSVNRILGSNIKVSLKAIRQLLTASSEDEENSAVFHILKCGLIRAERTLNARLRKKKKGRPVTPYLTMLSRSELEGEVIAPRYVPNELVLSPFKAHETTQGRPADWRPENHTSYLQPQIEKVVQRYGFQGSGERHNWTINDDATGNYGVPFIFSKLSVVLKWTWHS